MRPRRERLELEAAGVCCHCSSEGSLDRGASGWVVVVPDVTRQPPMIQLTGIDELMTQTHDA